MHSCGWIEARGSSNPAGSPSRTQASKVARNIHANQNSISEQCYLVKENSALTKTDLRRRVALRKPLPERLALTFPTIEEGQPQDARLMNFNIAGQTVDVSLYGCDGTVKMLEKHSSLWRVLFSDCDLVVPGTLIQMYDTTPNIQAPDSAEVTGEVKTSVLQSSEEVGDGDLAWNGMDGFSPANCPREFDGVHVTYRVWSCQGASGACNLLQEAEDPDALVCEFGSLKKGIMQMVPGETRRFWIPQDAQDRRFGRPPPDRSLPMGDLVVDLTLLDIKSEAVFTYKLSDESIKLGEIREKSPAVVAQRALGVGIQLWTWAMVYSSYQEAPQAGLPESAGLPKCSVHWQPAWLEVRFWEASTGRQKAWDDADGDDDLWETIRGPPPGQINSFVPGASLQDAKIFAATRTMAVAPWSEDVTPKPIFAVSDGTGQVANMVAEMAFRQFGDVTKSIVEVIPGIQTEDDVKRAVEKAADLAPEESLAIEQAGAMLIYSLADKGMGEFLVKECGQQGVPCINSMEAVLLAIENRLQLSRGSKSTPGAPCSTLFAVSDSSADLPYLMACKALKQFPNADVENMTLCPRVQTLQEIDHIVQKALAQNSVIIYTLASPGMSRFLRQQCERAKVPYADAFQPVVIALERYLDYPPVGVPGGHYSKRDELPAESLERAWKELPIE
ncbi:unnamed protein product [Effrenium voratum]|uniref:Uncharacterized protein n=1 Tax=Effrenium voratum TaxID=2562239 RepID=A0AA36JSV4_9DINO|nr:unnamed protein product [Effrenium voratum]